MTSRHLTERLSKATSQRLSAALRAAEQALQDTHELTAQERDRAPVCAPTAETMQRLIDAIVQGTNP